MDAFTAALTLYALLLFPVFALAAFRGRRTIILDPPLAGLAVLLTVRAAWDAATLLGGHQPAQPTVHLAYLLVAPAVLPPVLWAIRGDRGRWAAALCAGAVLLAAVLLVRLQSTWRSGHV
ncbi:hypothetical protein [Streptomyces aureus]|uniref:hypothetical protein n=1 Tax=Streptomyces aureus TaxID=193461 RepID=UPI0033E40876